MRLSGWCSAPEGARPMCDGCRVLDCEHECHEKPVVDSDSRAQVRQIEGQSWDTEGTNQDGPGGSQLALQAGIPGPRPTLDRSAEL